MSDYLAFAKNLNTNKVVIINTYIDDFFFWIRSFKINIIKSILAN